MCAKVAILVQPVGLPTAIAVNYLSTVPVKAVVATNVVLTAASVRALPDGCGLRYQSIPVAVNSATFKDIQVVTAVEDSNINMVAVTNVNYQSCDAVAPERGPSECVLFEIGEDDDGCSSASDTEQFSCGADLCGKATLDLPAVLGFPALTDTLSHERGCANITDIPLVWDGLEWTPPSTGIQKDRIRSTLSTTSLELCASQSAVALCLEHQHVQHQLHAKLDRTVLETQRPEPAAISAD